MNKRYSLLLFLFSTTHQLIFSAPIYQSIYELKFNLNQNSNLQYTALIIVQNNDINQVRVNCKKPDGSIKVIYTFPLIFKTADFNKVKDTLSTSMISGNEKTHCLPIYFNCFSSKHFDNNIKKVSFLVRGKLVPANIISVKYLRREDLQPKYVKQFFTEQDIFYTNLFINKTNDLQSTPWMYFINVGNTLDSSIGKGCSKDLQTVGVLFHQIALEMNMPLQNITLSGKNMAKQIVLSAIDNINPQKQDIVFFYYTGHGFSYKDDLQHMYPQLDLRSFPFSSSISVIDASTKNVEDVFNLIKAKGARFNLIVSDCCNNTIEFPRPLKNKNAYQREPITNPVNKIVLNNLFLKPNTSILISAAKKGQFAITDDDFGSIFTFNLSNKLIASIWGLSNDITWDDIFKTVQDKTNKMSTTYDIGGGVPGLQKPISNISDQ